MRGVSRSSAALTVVNALPTGTGCAIGFGRFVTATADLEPDRTATLECTPAESATPLVRASVAAALARYGHGAAVHTTLLLQSEIPVARGLKSSSAVSTATIRAVGRALGDEPNPLAVARIAAEVGRSVGVSASGALDDALASLRPGFVITDNRTDTVIGEGRADPAWSAVVYLPHGQHPPSPSLRGRFEAEAPAGHLAVSDVLAGRFLNAMEKNTELVERVMGYEDLGAPGPPGASGGAGFERQRPRAGAGGPRSFRAAGRGPLLSAPFRRAVRRPPHLGSGPVTTRTVHPGPIHGRADAPPSKSYTHRALVSGYLSGRRFVVRSPLDSDDTRATARALRRLGAPVTFSRERWAVGPTARAESRLPVVIDCGESGTTLRFAVALAALGRRPTRFRGHGRLARRPCDRCSPPSQSSEPTSARARPDSWSPSPARSTEAASGSTSPRVRSSLPPCSWHCPRSPRIPGSVSRAASYPNRTWILPSPSCIASE